MDIKIARTARQCHATGRPFEHLQPIVSLIRYVERDLQREDYAKDDWNPALADAAVAVWDATYIDPAVENAEPEESFSPLRRLFYEHAQKSGRESIAVCYLAAQLLRRQKVFRLVKETESLEDGGKVTLFADRVGDRLIEVRDPALTFAELDVGRTLLVACLQEAEAEAEPEEQESSATGIESEVEVEAEAKETEEEESDVSREEAAHAES